MHILLIQPPIEDFYQTEIRLQPIGLAYLKATIQKYFPEVKVTLRDYHLGHGKRTVARPRELAFLNDFYMVPDRSPFSTFYHYYRFGADIETIVRDVARLNPDLVGISSLFTAYAPQALQVAKAIRERLKIPVLLGGSHASADPQGILAEPFVDFVIRGEGEKAITFFIKEWLGKKQWQNVPNLGYKDQTGKLRLNAIQPNFAIDALPFPDLSDFNPHDYRLARDPLCFIISSRSCPYHCQFCSVHQTFGSTFRLRSVENILQELQLRVTQGYRVFDFEDDNFTFDLERIRALNSALRHELPAESVRLMAMNGVAYFRLDDEILSGMFEAGFRDLNLSLVSTNQKLMRQLKRPLHLKRFLNVVEHAFKLGMRVTAYQILGLPGESSESMIETLQFLAGLPVVIGVSPFYLTPGMPIASRVESPLPDWVAGRLTSLGAISSPEEREVVYTLFIVARMVNFLKNVKVTEQKISLNELLEEKEMWRGREAIGREILERLTKGKGMFGFDGHEFVPLPKFRRDVFEYFRDNLRFVRRTDGGIVYF